MDFDTAILELKNQYPTLIPGHLKDAQKDVIDRLLTGESVLSVLPTGYGKSLCYQLPALLMDKVNFIPCFFSMIIQGIFNLM